MTKLHPPPRRDQTVARGRLVERLSPRPEIKLSLVAAPAGYLFNGLQMERVNGTTVISGNVVDQAQLHGYIQRIEELGLELLTVEQVNESR